MPARQFISKLTPRGWLAVGGAAAVAVVFLVLVFHMASAPSYSTMLTGLDPAQTGKITSTLDSKGIGYQIQNNGTALAVQSGQTGQARIALASAGLLGTSSQPGMELLNNQQLGASNFQQQITYQRALEGQLAQTIEQIQDVSGAQVQLVLPNTQDQLFSDTQQQATAAVLLSDGGSLDPNSVRGIAQLVANSVPNLPVSKVTITDQTGQLLWPSGDTGGGDTSLIAKQAAQARYDSQMAAQVNAMLVQQLGAGKASVAINADLNTNQTTQDSVTYANKGVPLTQSVDKETLTGTGTGTGGVAGTAGNIPATAAPTGSASKSNYNPTITGTSFGYNKVVGHTTVSPGTINRQSVNITFDKSVPAATQASVKNAVAAAVGLNAKRGDTITTGSMTFAKIAAPAPVSSTSKMVNYAKYGLVGLGTIMGEPTWLRELDVPRALPALEGGGALAPALDQPTQVIPTLQSPINVARRQVEDLVDRDADRVAQQVRAWMSED
jgi:flagellar M-ring protein FliF